MFLNVPSLVYVCITFSDVLDFAKDGYIYHKTLRYVIVNESFGDLNTSDMSLTLYCLMMDTPSVWYWSGWGDPHIPAVILFAQWWWSRGYWGGEISACRGGPWTGSFSYSPLVTPCSPQCWQGLTLSPSPTNTVYANDILWYDYLHFFHFGLYKFYTCIMFWPWFLHSTFMRLEKLVLFLYSVSLLELFDSCCFYTYLSREVLPLEWFG